MVNEIVTKPSLDAQTPIVWSWKFFTRGDFDDLVVFDAQLELTSHTTVGAGGHGLADLPRASLEPGLFESQRPRRADIHALAAEDTIGVLERRVVEGGDEGIGAAGGHIDHPVYLHFQTSSHATPAKHALVLVPDDHGVGFVLGPRLELGLDAELIDPVFIDQVLQLAVTRLLTKQAVVVAVGQQ